MSPERLFWYLTTRALAVLIALYVLHRLALWLERQSYIYYWHNKPTGGGVTNAALELDRIVRASVEYHVAAEGGQVESEENEGE